MVVGGHFIPPTSHMLLHMYYASNSSTFKPNIDIVDVDIYHIKAS